MTLPKKPLAVSRAKKKLPVELDWGPGIPKDRLRYINAKEEALIQRFRKTKAVRDYAGVRAYPDPGDTAAGEKGKGGTTTGKTTGSGSSSGGLGQGGQSKGPSGAGQGPNSPAGTQKSPTSGSKSAPSSPKSPSAASPSPSTGSKAPNAAAQAASDKLKAKTSAPAAPKTNAGAPTGGSKAPNAAAAAASQKLNATSNAIKTAQDPKSIQAMINANTAQYPSRGDTPGTKPTDKYNVPNWGSDIGAVFKREAADLGVPNAYVDNSPQRFHDWGIQKLADYYNRTPQQISEMARTTYGEAANQGPLGMAAVSNTMENRLKYGSTYSGFGRGDIGRMLSKFDANGYDYGVRRGVPEGGNAAYQNAVKGTEGMTGGLLGMSDALDRYSDFSMTAPDAVKNATHYYNPRDAQPSWGKGFTAYGDHVFGNPDPGPTANRIATLRGNQGLGTVGLAAAAPPREPDLASQPPQGIPAPDSVGMLGPQQAAPQAPQVAGDPRVSMPPGSYPQAPEMGSPPGYFSQFGMTQQDMTNLQQQAMKDFSFGQLMEMRKNIDALPGFMGPITKDQERMAAQPQERVLGVENYVDTTGIRDPQAATMSAPPQQTAGLPASIPGFNPPGLVNNFRGTPGQAYTGNLPGYGYSPLADGRPAADSSGYASSGWGSSPSTFASAPPDYSPEAAPGDAVPEDGPMYSDNPIQGPSNPMQEGPQVEDPAVKSERQKKYATRGATIGSVIAGPIGAIVGGTLGWQMGKTTPGQRRAIASNPQALNANVQSINQLAEERGGKGNPRMQVTPKGFQDVLTDPIRVLQQPEQYTDLEQMLAALAAGIDPETGKPI